MSLPFLRTPFLGKIIRFPIVCSKIYPHGSLLKAKVALPSASCRRYSSRPTIGPISNKDAAHLLAIQLSPRERQLLLEELKKCDEEFDSKEVGSTGHHVTSSELWDVFVFHSVPFIGFGFLDNFIMIVAGEYIDVTIGAALGISTMAAAALGNLISDIAGVGSQGYIESVFMRLGMKTINLSPGQAQLFVTRCVVNFGRVIGIAIGCFIGMFPLLFFPNREEETAKKERAIEALQEKSD